MRYLDMKFKSMESLKHFVYEADKIPKRIDVETDDIVISGRSLLGLVAIALKGPVTVIVEDCEETKKFVSMLKSTAYNAKEKMYVA